MSDAPPSPAGRVEYELRGADGRLRGLYDVAALRALLYTGEVDAACKVRPVSPARAWPQDGPGAEWAGVHTVPALAEVMQLLDIEPIDADADRRIAGWQRTAVIEEEEYGTSTQDISQVLRAASPPSPRQERLPVAWLLVGTVLLLLVFVVLGLILS